MKVAIIDYGSGNLDSIERAVEECGGEPVIVRDSGLLEKFSHIILPGVGSFASAMKSLEEKGFVKALQEQVIGEKIPLLGVCLGMQVLGEMGQEGGETKGLGFIKGRVIRFEPKKGERVPHIGWNEVIFKKECPIFQGIETGKDFYFVHSYHLVCSDKEDVASETLYGENFVSAVSRGNIFGVQFHPEKSQSNGFKVIKKFLNVN